MRAVFLKCSVRLTLSCNFFIWESVTCKQKENFCFLRDHTGSCSQHVPGSPTSWQSWNPCALCWNCLESSNAPLKKNQKVNLYWLLFCSRNPLHLWKISLLCQNLLQGTNWCLSLDLSMRFRVLRLTTDVRFCLWFVSCFDSFVLFSSFPSPHVSHWWL